ncbi:hypothetical protein D3C85_477690 [compost metagenome]
MRAAPSSSTHCTCAVAKPVPCSRPARRAAASSACDVARSTTSRANSRPLPSGKCSKRHAMGSLSWASAFSCHWLSCAKTCAAFSSSTLARNGGSARRDDVTDAPHTVACADALACPGWLNSRARLGRTAQDASDSSAATQPSAADAGCGVKVEALEEAAFEVVAFEATALDAAASEATDADPAPATGTRNTNSSATPDWQATHTGRPTACDSSAASAAASIKSSGCTASWPAETVPSTVPSTVTRIVSSACCSSAASSRRTCACVAGEHAGSHMLACPFNTHAVARARDTDRVFRLLQQRRQFAADLGLRGGRACRQPHAGVSVQHPCRRPCAGSRLG